MADHVEIHKASEKTPLLLAKEPGFRKFFAKGFVVLVEDTILRICPYDEKEDVEIDPGDAESPAASTGYHLECQIITDWIGVLRLRDLLSHHIAEYEAAYGELRVPNKQKGKRANVS